MNLDRRNFEDIKAEFYLDRTAPKASRILRKRTKKQLFWLLRHHDEEGITEKETWERDYFDYLLAYYSIVEVALTIGFVRTLPIADRKKAVSELFHPALRSYYEKNYPLELPGRLLGRLRSGKGERVPNVGGHATGLFMDFMTLTGFLETDEDMETFLWFLDGGERGGYWYKDTLRVLGSAERLARSMTKSPKKKNDRDRSVEGFIKFLSFSVQLDALLCSSAKWPGLQRAMYVCHSYWFVRMREKLRKKLDKALDTYIEVEALQENGRADFATIRSAVNRLLSDVYRG